ncbi:MAG: fimbrillin family protein, partial [Bacteroidales bacterium]|nr:fimbrillin family protein [Bacteroidales bacterium]
MENPAESNVPVSLSYSTVAAIETKAAQNLNEGTFASGESVKVRISNTGADSWTDYTFTTAAAGAMTAPDPAPYYPAGSQNIDIVAYYPATAGSSFTVATDQTSDVSYKASDLMFASITNQAKQSEAVNLAFSHKMAKLNVNITAGSGVSSINSVSILNVKPTVSFNQATGAVGEATGSATTIAISNNGAAVIPAQTIDGELLSIVTDKGTATYSVSNKAFAAGQLFTLNITVNILAVGTTTAITGWTSEGTVTVNPVTKQKTPPGLEAIDMGNGLKWANMNVGAESVTGYG